MQAQRRLTFSRSQLINAKLEKGDVGWISAPVRCCCLYLEMKDGEKEARRTQRVEVFYVGVCLRHSWEAESEQVYLTGQVAPLCLKPYLQQSGRVFLCAEDKGRKIEVSWVEERKEELPVWISGLNIWWMEEYQIIPGAFKSHKVASSKSHNSSDSDSFFCLGPPWDGEADTDKGRGVFLFCFFFPPWVLLPKCISI